VPAAADAPTPDPSTAIEAAVTSNVDTDAGSVQNAAAIAQQPSTSSSHCVLASSTNTEASSWQAQLQQCCCHGEPGNC
jgi:hypothetical protein